VSPSYLHATMKKLDINDGESEKKARGYDDNSPSKMELSEGIKEFYAGLVSQVTTTTNTLLDAKIEKLNEVLAECIRNYNDIRIELEAISNGNKRPGNSYSH
jgi:hypothetical protein